MTEDEATALALPTLHGGRNALIERAMETDKHAVLLLHITPFMIGFYFGNQDDTWPNTLPKMMSGIFQLHEMIEEMEPSDSFHTQIPLTDILTEDEISHIKSVRAL